MRKKTPRLAIEMIEGPASPAEALERTNFIRRFKEAGLDELVLKKAHNWAGHLPGAGRPGKFSACTFPWNALAIFFDGTVAPCAQDFFGRGRLGSAATTPLLEIWNGLPMQKLRQAHAEGRIAGFQACSGCDRVRRHTLGGIPIEYLKQMLSKRMP